MLVYHEKMIVLQNFDEIYIVKRSDSHIKTDDSVFLFINLLYHQIRQRNHKHNLIFIEVNFHFLIIYFKQKNS